jgi:rhodanese-related sulfurtransferase
MRNSLKLLCVPFLLTASLSGCHPFTTMAMSPTQYTEQAMATAPRVTPEQVQARLAKGDTIILVDVRAPEAYWLEHIKGSVSYPRATLAASQQPLPKDKPIVLYCTCQAEHSAAAAALDLQKQGYTNVKALLGGMNDWKAKGYATETSAMAMPLP